MVRICQNIYWIVLMCFEMLNALLARKTSNIKSGAVELPPPLVPT